MPNRGRLVTSGCSFSDYCWPTWADYLGLVFDEYLSCGEAGSDNASIARNIIKNTRPNDTVVILWSGWNRHIMWSDVLVPTPKTNDNNWQYIHAPWDKNWLVNFYNPTERLATSMDYVKMIDLDSRVKGYTAYHFSAFPWTLGEIEKYPPKHFDKIFNSYHIQNNFLLEENLEDYKIRNGFAKPVCHKYNPNDAHPTPMCQYQYLMNVMVPKFKFDVDLNILTAVNAHEQWVRAGNVIDDKSKQGLLNDQSIS